MIMKQTSLYKLSAAILFAATLGTSASAGEVLSSQDLIDQLAPKTERGLASVAIVGPSVDLSIQFEFNSTKLTSTAIQQLDNVGAALSSSALDNFDFLLVGHTDGVGSRRYNQTLSEKRADSVRKYLVEKYGLSDSRLASLGMGEDTLLFIDDPKNGDNRRVELRNIGGAESKVLRGGGGKAPIVNTNTITSATSPFCLTEGTLPTFAMLNAPAVDEPIVVRRRTAPRQVMNATWPAGAATFAWRSDWPLPAEGRYIWAIGDGGTSIMEILVLEGDPKTLRDKAAAYHDRGCEAQVVAAFNEIVAASQ